MRLCNKCGLEKSKAEFSKHKLGRDGLHPSCIQCERVRQREWALENKDRVLQNSANYRARNRAALFVRQKKWNSENHERNRARRHEQYLLNREKIQAASKLHAQENRTRHNEIKRLWDKRNRGLANAKTARRYASKIKATPAWANMFFVGEIYELAALRTKITGIRWNVDHRVPLNSDVVCGLHWEGNLQVLPRLENIRKSNKLTEAAYG